jgi:serine/threonine protein kinase
MLYNGSLADWLAKDGKPPLKTAALGQIAQIARALKSVHAQGAAVLDLKPANLLFDEDGALNISDFGIAYVADMTMTTSSATAAAGKGTPAYMAPEQHDPHLEYGLPGPAADIFLGTRLCAVRVDDR